MKFKVNSYHFKLLRDYERLSAFKEAIDDYAIRNGMYSNGSNDKVAFDLGCGSGVLSFFAREHVGKVMAIELNNSTYQLAKENLKEFDKIQVVNDDLLSFDFSKLNEKADLIICEMLDTALIDEEEVPVLNRAREFLNDDGEIIPRGMINSVEAIFMNNHFIQYEDDEYSPIYISLGESVVYSEFDFMNEIDCNFSAEIELKIYGKEELDEMGFEEKLSQEKYEKFNFKENFNIEEDKLKINGIKLTSFTKLNENIICGPTPMLNPEMLIPIKETEVSCGDSVRIGLEYVMGGGVETIKTDVLEIIHQ